MTNFEQYITAVQQAQRDHPTLRQGQAAFNILEALYPSIAREVRGTEFDPFHRDDRIPAFLLWLHLSHPDTF